MSTNNQGKEISAITACKFIRNGQTIGLGTGSTANFFISHLGRLCKEGLDIKAVATSDQSYELAKKNQIPLIDINSIETVDLAVDGADEADPELRLIKGGGGALFREKIVASMAKTFIVLVDESKMVDNLGAFPLPVEILPFAWRATVYQIKSMGYRGSIRKKDENNRFITDNGNYIFDINLAAPQSDPETIEKSLIQIPGVIETGFFINMADKIIIGQIGGLVKIIDRSDKIS